MVLGRFLRIAAPTLEFGRMVEGSARRLSLYRDRRGRDWRLEFSAGDGAKTIPGLGATAANTRVKHRPLGLLPENSMRRAPLAR